MEVLSRLVLAPLEQSLADIEHWLISPDGALWLVPWPALPLRDGRYAVEQHRITHVISGRELAVGGYKPRPVTAGVVMGDPDFDLEPGLTLPPLQLPLLEGRVLERSGSVVPTNWARLSGTADEVRAIMPKLTTYLNAEPTVHLGKLAMKHVLVSSDRPRVVVLSTHGFFLDDPE